MDNNRISTQSLVEGALMAVLTVVLMFIGMYIPVLGFVVRFFIAVPITILVVRQNFFVAVLAAVAASFIAAIFLGPLGAISCFIQYMPLGLVVGAMFAKRRGAGKSMVAAIVTSAISMIIIIALGFAISGLSMDNLNRIAQEITTETLQLYEQMGMTEILRQQGITTEVFREMINRMMKMLPSMVVIFGGVQGLIHFLLTRMVFRKLKLKIPRMPVFTKWHLPFHAVWGLIGAWTLWLGSDYLAMDTLKVAAQNVLMIYGVLLLVVGMAVVAHYMDFKHISSTWKVLCVFLLLFFFNGVIILCALAGLADLIFDFRKVRSPNASKVK